MSAMSPVPKNHPLMLAWEAHKQTEEYANSKKWAVHPQHIDGSLWALFSAGWQAAQPAQSVDVGAILEVIASLNTNADDLDRIDVCPMLATHLRNSADKLTAALQEKGNG